MAHDPVWFEPVVSPQRTLVDLKAWIQKGGRPQHITYKVVEGWNETFRTAIVQTATLAMLAIDPQTVIPKGLFASLPEGLRVGA